MKIEKCNFLNLGLVYDGTEDGYYEFKLILPFGNNLEEVKEGPFQFVYINNLLKILDLDQYKLVISMLSTAIPSQLIDEMYLGTQNFPLTFAIHNSRAGKKYIIIVSSGEFQPGRYKIYLEDILEISE